MSEAPATESPDCVLCGGADFQVVLPEVRDVIWHKPGRFSLQRCARCDLVMTRPRPTVEGLDFYYEDAYSGEAKEGMKRFQTTSWVGRLINAYRLKVLAKVRPLVSDDRLLDVGCSYGGFLRAARARAGCQTSGIDLDAGSIAEAVDPALTDYRVGRVEDAERPAGGFTVITFFECLEHTRDPVAALRAAHRLLAPGGLCLVEVPNFGGLWRRIFRTSWLPLLVPQHLMHFTPETLRRAFEAAGFERIEHQQSMFFPLEGVASLGIAISRALRLPPKGTPPSWRTPFHMLAGLGLLLLLVALYPLAEIPSQLLLALTGHTGHQVMIGRR